MEINFINRLVLCVPKEKHADIIRIVEAFVNDEEEFCVDDMLIDEYEAIIDERDRLAEQLRTASKKAEGTIVTNEFGYEVELNIDEYKRMKELYLDASKELEQAKQYLNMKDEKISKIEAKLIRIRNILCE